jgi:hypothetical protein
LGLFRGEEQFALWFLRQEIRKSKRIINIYGKNEFMLVSALRREKE